ncbi:MAG: response regulator [Dehalococcoidia bacterium]|nr:response regulator [Dehalococcoidia bacterium]
MYLFAWRPHAGTVGYAPIATSDPADVPRLMAEEKPHLVLPGTDGIELMDKVRKAADVPVIFISVYGQDETVARAFDMGA